jgi:hypothetical protein
MAQRTLLQIVNQALLELGLPTDTVVVTSQNQSTTQMYGFANQEIETLYQARNGGWTFLQKEFNIAVNPPINLTGNIGLNSAVITGITPNTNGLTAGLFALSAPNVPPAARIQSVDSSSQVTLTMEATAATAGAALIFSQDTYAEPSDFGFFINRTWWDRTNHWELLGPDSPQLDQWHRSGIVATGPRRHYRQLGQSPNNFRLWPPPTEITNPLQLVFEYVSNNPVLVNGTSTTSRLFNNDADIPILDDRAIIMGLKWRFYEQKGFDWLAKRSDYDDYVQRLIARDGGRETLNMVQRVNPIFISPANVQDGFFPGPIGPNQG